MQALTRFNALLARYGMYFSVGGLMVIVAIVAFQVFGRYVMNDSPTWTENLALVLILYVTLIGGGAGGRVAGTLSLVTHPILLPRGTPAHLPQAGHLTGPH